MTQRVVASYRIDCLSLDAWSETYIAARWLVEDELPRKQWEALPRHGPLSQLALIAAHQLVEIALFSSVERLIRLSLGAYPKEEWELSAGKVPFSRVFTRWPQQLGKPAFDLAAEPFKSVESLRKQRNRTVHAESALVSLPMARAAVHSAVEGSRAITDHLLGAHTFAYDRVLASYPLNPQPPFSAVSAGP